MVGLDVTPSAEIPKSPLCVQRGRSALFVCLFYSEIHCKPVLPRCQGLTFLNAAYQEASPVLHVGAKKRWGL